MSKRHIRTMLRTMESGETVKVTRSTGSVRTLARLAFIAQQFGYAYADAGLGGFKSEQLVLRLVPDPGPEARARAARNRELYPNAGDGVSLPPLVREEVDFLEARISFDITTQYTGRQRLAIGIPALTVLAAAPCLRFGVHSTVALVAGIVWAVLMALLPLGLANLRRKRAGYAARLLAAGFTPVTDMLGRLRYVPPGGQLPGRGDPSPEGA
ncbi:hypothetical protein [Streptomyces sp. NBC_00859]|uniref:hypothetical protein n=1 Tax=Streptomyces sp. NBC_00859 TaxID=2903682 RepID=UPI00386CDCD4|nr:hypothetical protein OG584_20655 [Streptomyces sp. NBC_00859]